MKRTFAIIAVLGILVAFGSGCGTYHGPGNYQPTIAERALVDATGDAAAAYVVAALENRLRHAVGDPDDPHTAEDESRVPWIPVVCGLAGGALSLFLKKIGIGAIGRLRQASS